MLRSSIILCAALLSSVEVNAQTGTFARTVEQSLLGAGISVDVSMHTGGLGASKHFIGEPPTLLLFGYFSKSLVFQVITRMEVLEGAKAAGFHSVTFYDRGDEGFFIFDISKPEIPRCALRNRVCR